MIQSFYTGDSGLNANKYWLSVISDNIANVNTVGFKGERATFEDLVSSSLTTFSNGSPKNVEIGGGAFMGSTVKDFQQGTFMNTSTPTDLALDGGKGSLWSITTAGSDTTPATASSGPMRTAT